eukprot:XP_001702894.1 predicted protein [Chlamydomonas reinhardtii]
MSLASVTLLCEARHDKRYHSTKHARSLLPTNHVSVLRCYAPARQQPFRSPGRHTIRNREHPGASSPAPLTRLLFGLHEACTMHSILRALPSTRLPPLCTLVCSYAQHSRYGPRSRIERQGARYKPN